MSEGNIKLERILGIQWITWFHRAYFALDAIERENRLAKLLSTALRRFVKGEPKHELGVSSQSVVSVGCELAQIAYLAVNVNVLR